MWIMRIACLHGGGQSNRLFGIVIELCVYMRIIPIINILLFYYCEQFFFFCRRHNFSFVWRVRNAKIAKWHHRPEYLQHKKNTETYSGRTDLQPLFHFRFFSFLKIQRAFHFHNEIKFLGRLHHGFAAKYAWHSAVRFCCSASSFGYK